MQLIKNQNIMNNQELNELEQKIRKSIPELGVNQSIQLNHVLEYLLEEVDCDFSFYEFVNRWNLKSNLLSDQSEELIKFLNEL